MSGDSDEADIADLLARLQNRDEEAAREVHRRFTGQLIGLARSQVRSELRAKVDPESIVQSVFGSFFHRFEDGQFEIGDFDDLWGLLTVITLRKCADRSRFFHRARRDVSREVGFEQLGGGADLVDSAVEPIEMVILSETLQQLFEGFTDREQRIIELLLAGHTVEETRQQLQCGERTVRRVRDRARTKLNRSYRRD